MPELFANNAATTINGGITDVATTIALAAGTGSRFPNPTGGDYFFATLYQLVGEQETNHEIVLVTARATDSLTVVRGQQGTTARAWTNGSPIELRWTKTAAESFPQHAGHAGDFTFSGNARRIRGDLNNATHANRLMIQGSATNQFSGLGVIPNGTAVSTVISGYNASDPDNASAVQLVCNATTTIVRSNKVGAGTYLPLAIEVNAAEKFRIALDGAVGLSGAALQTVTIPSVHTPPNAVIGALGATLTLAQNMHYNGGWKYSTAAAVSSYEQNGAAHTWYSAASGAAGNAVTRTTVLTIDGVAGNLTATGNVTAYSDRRVKKDIQPITGALWKVQRLTGVTFARTDTDDDRRHMGLIAQDAQSVVPEAVLWNKERDRYSIAYGNLTALLIEAIKEQQRQIQEQAVTIADLVRRVGRLERA